MTAGMGCQVYVEGEHIADTAAEYLQSIPTVLTGLSLVWGRETTVDQPDVSTCSFTVADIDGDAGFLSVLHVGRVVDVLASADISGGTDPVDVIVDGSFETEPLSTRIRYSGGTAVIDTSNPADGNKAIRAAPQNSVRIIVPPAPFSDVSTAWNTIPKAFVGQQWQITAQVLLGNQSSATLQPVIFASPVASDGTPVGAAVPIAAHSGYATVTAPWTVTTEGWLGAVLTVTGLVRWVDLVGPWTAQNWVWQDAGTALLDDMHILAPPQAQSQVLAFSGRITDLTAQQGEQGRVEVSVTASDRLADLGNDYIGDNPWLVQTIANRVKRITALAATSVAVNIDSWPGGRSVTWVDIDSQPVSELLSDLATTADAVMWSVFVANRGFYLWMEDIAQRQSMAYLALDTGSGLVKITGATRPGVGIAVSACEIVGSSVQWIQDVADVMSIVDLTWLQQLTDEDGQPDPTETHIVLTDSDAVGQYGQRRLGYETQLVSSTDGNTVATRLMARSRSLGWRVSGMEWDTNAPADFADENRATALHILDGSKRIGLPIVISDLPDWTPSGESSAPCYLEGGTYTYESGRWTLAMNLSPAGLSGKSLTWAQCDPSFTWAKTDPAIAWYSMWGVGVAPAALLEEAS
jgi:hypothetical protein